MGERMLRGSRLGICIFTVVSASFIAGAPHTLARPVDHDPDPVPNSQKDEKTPTHAILSVSIQQLIPPLSASLPLKGFAFRSENEILDESSIKKNDVFEENANNISAWISRSKNGTTRSEISERCQKTFGNSATPFKITGANLACAPWMLERIAILRDSKRRAGIVKPASQPHVRNEQQWATLANQNFSIAFARLDPANVTEMIAMKNMALKTQFDCKFTGATSAFIARAETFLPDERAMETIETLYPGAFACLEPDMDGYERTHQRVGMLRLLKGESLIARQSLLLASRAEEPKEDFRTLFWLGVIDENEPLLSQDLQSAGVKRNYWKELHERHLLSLHSVLAAHYQGRDPMDMTTRGADIKVNRRIGETASEFNMVAFVFELLIARGDSSALAHWSQFVSRTFELTDTGASVFLALAHNRSQNFRGSIAAITQFLRETKNSQISPELIQLYFPRP